MLADLDLAKDRRILLAILGLLLLAACGFCLAAHYLVVRWDVRSWFVEIVLLPFCPIVPLVVAVGLLVPPPWLPVWVGGVGGARSGFVVLGLCGLVACEVGRLTGSPVEFSLFSAAVFLLLASEGGAFLGQGLIALMLAGMNRGWLLGLAVLVVPSVAIALAPELREDLVSGTASLNYALVALLCWGFGLLALPGMRMALLRELEYEKFLEETRSRRIAEPLSGKRSPPDPAKEAGPTHEILLTSSGLVAAACPLAIMGKTNKSTT